MPNDLRIAWPSVSLACGLAFAFLFLLLVIGPLPFGAGFNPAVDVASKSAERFAPLIPTIAAPNSVSWCLLPNILFGGIGAILLIHVDRH